MFDYFEHHSDGRNSSNDREGRDFFFYYFYLNFIAMLKNSSKKNELSRAMIYNSLGNVRKNNFFCFVFIVQPVENLWKSPIKEEKSFKGYLQNTIPRIL